MLKTPKNAKKANDDRLNWLDDGDDDDHEEIQGGMDACFLLKLFSMSMRRGKGFKESHNWFSGISRTKGMSWDLRNEMIQEQDSSLFLKVLKQGGVSMMIDDIRQVFFSLPSKNKAK